MPSSGAVAGQILLRPICSLKLNDDKLEQELSSLGEAEAVAAALSAHWQIQLTGIFSSLDSQLK